jgi:hypothetical protein
MISGAERALYTNADKRGSVLGFFITNASQCARAHLACPFFTSIEPLTQLKNSGVREIRLIVRLCFATMPDVVRAACKIPGVSIRYFTGDAFHAKFYILGDIALVGSGWLRKLPCNEPKPAEVARQFTKHEITLM